MPKPVRRKLLLDFDGCLSHKTVGWAPESNIVSGNPILFNYIAQQVKGTNATAEDSDDEIIPEQATEIVTVAIGSNRQSYFDDLRNALNNSNGFCVQAIQQVAIGLSTHLSQSVQVEPILLSDLYYDLPPGTSFRRALQASHLFDEYFERVKKEMAAKKEGKSASSEKISDEQAAEFEKAKTNLQHHSRWMADESKLSILYAHMWQMAIDFPDDENIIDFFDDKYAPNEPNRDILNNLKLFFEANPDLIPKNVTLNLHHYEGQAVKSLASIKGQATRLDKNYRDTIIKMAEMTLSPQNRTKEQFFDPTRVATDGAIANLLPAFQANAQNLSELKQFIRENNPIVLPRAVCIVAISQYDLEQNQAIFSVLFNNLKAQGIKDIYLSVKDVGDYSTQISLLEAQGFTVHGVLHHLDAVYNKGLGAFYRDFLQPVHKQLREQKFSSMQEFDSDPEGVLFYLQLILFESLRSIFNDYLTGISPDLIIKKIRHNENLTSHFVKEKLLPVSEGKKWSKGQEEKLHALLAFFEDLKNPFLVKANEPQDFSKQIMQLAQLFLGGPHNWFLSQQETVRKLSEKIQSTQLAPLFFYFFMSYPDWIHSAFYCSVNELDNQLFKWIGDPNSIEEEKLSQPAEPSEVTESASQTLSFDEVLSEEKEEKVNHQQAKIFIDSIHILFASSADTSRLSSLINNAYCDCWCRLYSVLGEKKYGRNVEEIIDNLSKVMNTVSEGQKTKTIYYHSLLALIERTLREPSEDTLKACFDLAREVEGASSFGKRLAGVIMMLIGALAAIAGVVLSFIVTPVIGAPVGGLGVALLGSGAYLFFNGRQKGLSKCIVDLGQAIQADPLYATPIEDNRRAQIAAVREEEIEEESSDSEPLILT